MKIFLLSIVIITSLAACNNTPKDDTRDIQLLSDPSAYRNNIGADTAAVVATTPVTAAEVKSAPQVITVTKRIVYVPAKTINTAPVTQPTIYAPPVASKAPNPVPATTNDNVTTQPGTAGGTTESPVATTTETEKNKGWSAAAKGAAIGAGAGAIGGAIFSKKKGLGAIVGGVVGAAGGYIIGKDIDKKNNRLVMSN